MTHHDAILERCAQDSAIISRFVDEFLVYYCSDRERLKRHFDREIIRYMRGMEDLPEELYRKVLMQYVAARLFRKGGYAAAYRGHSIMRTRDDEERTWLDEQVKHPWRWSFCRIHTHVIGDLREMVDFCTGEHFLLYSPSITRQLDEGYTPVMWLLLLTDNGRCRQTYGPLLPFKGLFPHDVLLLTRMLNSRVRRLDQIPDLVDNDPIPYLMLWRGAELPVIVHKRDILMFNRSDLEHVQLDVERCARRFSSQYEGGVACLRLKYWSRHPHYAEAYYDSKRGSLIATALTDRGWEKLVAALREAGVDIPQDADIRGSINATLLITKILGLDVADHPYRELFEEPPDPDQQASLDRINDFVALWTEAWNTGTDFDLEEAARITDLDLETARGIAAMIEQQTRGARPRPDNE